MTLESHYDEPLYFIQKHAAQRTYKLHACLEGLIQEEAEVICPLLVEEVEMFQ
jgi:hypothetical protein